MENSSAGENQSKKYLAYLIWGWLASFMAVDIMFAGNLLALRAGLYSTPDKLNLIVPVGMLEIIKVILGIIIYIIILCIIYMRRNKENIDFLAGPRERVFKKFERSTVSFVQALSYLCGFVPVVFLGLMGFIYYFLFDKPKYLFEIYYHNLVASCTLWAFFLLSFGLSINFLAAISFWKEPSNNSPVDI